MIDILPQKFFFPLRDFNDVEELFRFNLNESNGEPNLALLSIVVGLVEHSLVTISDKDDIINNSRPVEQLSDFVQRKYNTNRLINSSSSHNQPLSSTSSELSREQQQHNNNQTDQHQQPKNNSGDIEFNEAGYNSSDDEAGGSCSSPEITAYDNVTIPEIEFEVVETLYKKFVDQIKGTIDTKDTEALKTNLKIKRISDSVWEHLSNSYYKDKPHLQSIFSYLTTNKLDCFGLAFAVISGCQILNLKNIYLALSEDHAWVMFDLNPEELKSDQKLKEIKEYTEKNLPVPTCALYGTCEVTWHGKANSDKRGQPVTYKNCWLYTNGYAVKCDVRLCVAALVNSINPSINANTDSEILALLQQRLLWLLFKKKIYFPMSLGNLGELENLCPTFLAPMKPYDLFNLGVEISRKEYNDSHVYPYSYLASFFFKNGRFKEALETWADSSAVMTKYKYSPADEEIYNEFSNIDNKWIPSMLKVLTTDGLEPGKVSLKPFLQDPECFALILKFYDNICCWEEGSTTPVLHAVWAKNFVTTVSKFSSVIRSKIKLLTEEEWNQNKAYASEYEVSSRADQCSSTAGDSFDDRGDEFSNSRTYSKKVKREQEGNDIDGHQVGSIPSDSKLPSQDNKGRKRVHSSDNKVDTSESATSKLKSSYSSDSTDVEGAKQVSSKSSDGPERVTRRLELDNDNNVILILKSRKIAGVRYLLQAEHLNRSAIELQLSAQSQCVVRGRSNSSSYSSDFISAASIRGSTRSKRLNR